MHIHLYVCVPVTLRSTTVLLYVFFMNIFNIKSSPQWVSVCWLLISIGVCLSICLCVYLSVCLFVCLCVHCSVKTHSPFSSIFDYLSVFCLCVLRFFVDVWVFVFIFCVSVHPCNSSVLLLFFCLLSCSFHGNSPVSQPVI